MCYSLSHIRLELDQNQAAENKTNGDLFLNLVFFSQELSSFTDTVKAKSDYHRFLIGRGGASIRKVSNSCVIVCCIRVVCSYMTFLWFCRSVTTLELVSFSQRKMTKTKN